jgi:predicted DNA-binding antitoxin AbrB/MazE fold protein
VLKSRESSDLYVVIFVAGLRLRIQQNATADEVSAYNGRMPLQVDAIYENGVLRPLQPLDLTEHEHVVVSVVKTAASGRSSLALEYIERIKREQQDAEPAPGHEELRRRLAKIPGSMAAEIVADRGER